MSKVLLIDDSEDVLDLFEFILSGFDFPFFLASSTEKAFELLENHEFSLIVSDVEMPGMSGIQFAKEVRRIQENTPVIYFTANTLSWLKLHFSSSEFHKNTFLVPDKNIDELLKIMGNHLGVKLGQ